MKDILIDPVAFVHELDYIDLINFKINKKAQSTCQVGS
jgi:hypothetical protein